MTRIASWVLSRAWRRGVLGGNRIWLVAGGLALGVRLVSKALRPEETVVFREVLGPGDKLVIDHLLIDRRAKG
jgi:hypothetical protein